MATTNKVLRIHARRGAKLLDVAEEGWRERVHLDELAMESSLHCVLGQLYGSYYRGLEVLLLGDAAAVALGFQFDDEYESERRAYGRLTQAWRDVLREV